MDRVGLALGGGAMRGMAHVGVLLVLERAGIPIDLVAGTSAGSLIGAAFCTGMSAAAIADFARQMRWRQLVAPTWPRNGLLSLDRLERWLVTRLGDLRFSDLVRPFAAVATDLHTGERVVCREGRLAPAVRASCSVPGFMAPVEVEGRLLGDGGMVDNLPVDVVRAMGAEYVIGVNVIGNRPSWTRGTFGLGLAAIETLIRSTAGGLAGADCLISPATESCSYIRLADRERLIALGQEAAEGQVAKIKAALGLP